MKQTSLLDSFLKKSIKSSQNSSLNQTNQNSSLKQNKNSQNNVKISTIQQNNQLMKIKQISNLQQSHNNQVQKMQIQQQKSDEQNKLHRLRKQSKKKNNKKQDSQQEYNASQQQSQKEEQSNCQQNQSQSQEQIEFNKKKKKQHKSVKKTNKKTNFSQKKNNTQRKVIINQNQNQIIQDTIAFDRSKFTDATPQWAIVGSYLCKDKYGLSSKDPKYDQTTLKVPDSAWKQFTAPMRQYWSIKSQNFDKIIFFKLGKFYQLFYEDALICNQLLNLKWMGTKMHVGFPQKSLNRYTQELVKRGLKVVVVEQMQTPQEMNNRIQQDKKHGRKSQKTLRRQVTQIITKGTLQPSQKQQNYLPNYLISVYRKDDCISYSLLEVSSNLILLGIVNGFEEFKTILYQTYPSELLYDPDNLPNQYIEIMKQNIQGLVFTKLINKNNLWHYLNATNQLQQLKNQGYNIPKIFQELQNWTQIHRNLVLSTLAGIFDYLHKIYKFQYVLSTAKFKFYEKQKALTHMILDSQALQHLEIFQTILGPEDSLFNKIDRTKTKFGKRLFRRWMTSPLLNQYHINQRLDSVTDLVQLFSIVDQIQKILIKLPDLQKMANRLYKNQIKNTSAASAIYFQDLNTNRLKQFNNFMKSLQQSYVIITFLENHIDLLRSQRLKRLIAMNKDKSQFEQEKLIFYEDEDIQQNKKTQKINGMLPDILGQLQDFKKYVIWKDGKPYPKPGIIQMYDQLSKKQNQIKNVLEDKLQQLRNKMNCSQINYVHIKQRYEVQIPQKKNLKIPKEYSFSSRKAGYSRYLVPEVQDIVEQLQIIQKGLKSQMSIFVTFFFEQFRQKQNIWERYISIIAEIDCLTGIAQYSKQRKAIRPIFVQQGYQVVGGVHPSLETQEFVPNDISFSDPIILLTGPNMGGKSTILRTSCLLAVMSQMGCFVPCKLYKASIIDRIFTRIGASDKLQAGKSTFFIQMEQTKSIVMNATNRSLAIIDQLGRGTATYDGMALAHSVLNYLIKEIKCKCMFATHYHSLTEQFGRVPEVCLKMMDYQIVQGEEDKILFLYKLVNGKAEKSFGLNVARLVGLPKNLIIYAKQISNQMHMQIQRKKKTIKVYEILREIQQIK